jgi:CxC2 like cysteine cluster associated with KDZ transposases
VDLKSVEDLIIDSIISTELDPLTNDPCRICATPSSPQCPALFRCEDCSIPQVMCSACIVERHHSCPFHWIQSWNGSFFERKSLKDLGLVIHLHHASMSCPHASLVDLRELTLVHINGIQTIAVQYCSCPGQIDELAVIRQLTEYRLFPATTKSPNTVFTHQVLGDFHMETNCLSISAYDYMEKLRRLTSRMFVYEVPVRLNQPT